MKSTKVSNLSFDPAFSEWAMSQLPIGLLSELAHQYYQHELRVFDQILSPDEVDLRKALEAYRGGDPLTDD